VPTWKYAKTLLINAILCNGKRKVSAALRAVGLSQGYHQVLSKSKSSAFSLIWILFGLLLELLPANAPVLIAVDETIERRSGKNITAKLSGCLPFKPA
jgi:hypothetical protein